MNRLDLFTKLREFPYHFGSTKRKERWKEALNQEEVPFEINCFGVDWYEIHGTRVRLFNKKLGEYQDYEIVEYQRCLPRVWEIDACSGDQRLIVVSPLLGGVLYSPT